MAAQTDFWGEIQADAIRTPASILREQAALLGPKTQNIIEAKVEMRTEGGHFWHSFDLVVPALDNYRYRLFQSNHTIGLYPLAVSDSAVRIDNVMRLETEEEFSDWLCKRLSSDETRRIIANLLAQARG